MALTPEEAGAANDAYIDEQATALEESIDKLLAKEWHKGASMVTVMPNLERAEWQAEILAEVMARYNAAGWKIERKHEAQKETWIFKRAR